MSVCTRCGSLQTRVIGGSIPARLLALLLRQDVIVCARCGFRGRQPRAVGTRRDHGALASAPAADAGLDLAELDRALDTNVPKTPPRQGGE